MNENQAAAYVAAQAALLNCRVTGMVAENQRRMNTCNVVSYGDDAFLAVEREFESMIGHNAVQELYRSR